MNASDKLVPRIVFYLSDRKVVFADPDVGPAVLRDLGLTRRRLHLPAWNAIHRFFAEQLELELIRVTLLEVFKAEICTEEPRRAVLKRDLPLAIDRGRPHPLIGRTIRMVDDKKRDAFDLRRGCKSQQSFTVAM